MLKVLIADDERLARVDLNRLLSGVDDIEVVGEARNGVEALDFLADHPVDLVFADIKMPNMDGLQLAKNIGGSTQFVFCTAYGEHAVDAFELEALDYIVKPIASDRLEAVLAKARKSLPTPSGGQPEEPTFLPEDHGLLLKFGPDYKIVRIKQIHRLQSVGNHVAVFSEVGQSFIHASLSKVERRLDPAHFFKASRSEIVRINQIDRIEEGMAPGSLDVLMKNGEEVVVSRRQAGQLRKLFTI